MSKASAKRKPKKPGTKATGDQQIVERKPTLKVLITTYSDGSIHCESEPKVNQDMLLGLLTRVVRHLGG